MYIDDLRKMATTDNNVLIIIDLLQISHTADTRDQGGHSADNQLVTDGHYHPLSIQGILTALLFTTTLLYLQEPLIKKKVIYSTIYLRRYTDIYPVSTPWARSTRNGNHTSQAASQDTRGSVACLLQPQTEPFQPTGRLEWSIQTELSK